MGDTLHLGAGSVSIRPLSGPPAEWEPVGTTEEPFKIEWKSPFQVYYDDEKGELVEEIDGLTRSILSVRAGLLEKHLTTAVITELERRGYVVFGPYLSGVESS